jgi:nondiscriminating glutamyl-tRNA synthetase
MSSNNEKAPRVRYAPSPTGLLHVGNLRTGLFAWLFARQQGGTFVLRIEDTDQARSERQFEDRIYEDLRWFGMNWDEGPDVGGPHGPYRQSERGKLYRDHADELVLSGKAYRCFCSEEELKRGNDRARVQGISWKYPGTCRSLPPEDVDSRIARGQSSVVRLGVRDGIIDFDDIVHGKPRFTADVISDPILLRSDSTPTYNYAVVIDDAHMQISHVIRGDDHLSNTPKQVLIYEALDAPVPCFAHLSTVLGPDQTKLSKRHGATSVAEFREAGYLPEALMNYIALLGWSPGADGSEIVSPERLVEEFRLDRVNKNPAIFDFGKLHFINRSYLRESPKTPALVAEQLAQAGLLPSISDATDDDSNADEWTRMVIDALIAGVDVVPEIVTVLREALSFPVDEESQVADCIETAEDEGATDLLRRFETEFKGRDHLTVEHFHAIVGELKISTGRKGRGLYHPLRLALTARSSGPELDKLIPLVEAGARLGIEGVISCRARVSAFLDRYGR